MSLLDDLLQRLIKPDAKPPPASVWPFERVVVAQACKNCCFYGTEKRKGLSGYVDVEVCRKNPPGPESWPQVKPSDWCGAFQATQAAINAAPRADVETMARRINAHLKREGDK
jgi:hypothetical protein